MRERCEWGRAASLAVMIGGLFAGSDPWKVVPERYRPGKGKGAEATPREMSPEERAVRQEIGLANLGSLLKRNG